MTHTNSENMVKWMADTVHRTYHQDKPGHFTECPMSLCRAAANHLRELEQERQAPPQASPGDERASERSWERGGFAGPAGWEGRI